MDVCFSQQTFNTYMFLLLIVSTYIVYVLYKKHENFSMVNTSSHLSQQELLTKVKQLQDQLYTYQLAEQQCQLELVKTKTELAKQSPTISTNTSLQKIYNPIVSPERVYQGPNSVSSSYQMIGYIHNTTDRFPLFGRYKYPGRSDRWEYYIIDETRNKLKIPFKTTNDTEITDGDDVNIPSLGQFTATIYEYEQFRYNPNVF